MKRPKLGRVAVTGGCGFIGSHVAERLGREGFNVLIVDNLQTSCREVCREVEVDYDARVFITSARSVRYVASARGGRLNLIVHLGQPSSSPLYWRHPKLFSETIREMQLVLEAAYAFDCPIVYASSSSVYAGNPVPWREDMPIKVWDRYGEVKYFSERMGELWAKRSKLRFVALRLFSVYGEREQCKKGFANLFTQLIWSALLGRSLKIYAYGDQTRDLVYVRDVAEAFYRATQLALSAEPGYFDVFNVGTGREVSAYKMIKIIREYGGVNPVYEMTGYVPDHYIMRTLADTKKAERELGWRATTRPEDIVKRLVDYYASRVDEILDWSPQPP